MEKANLKLFEAIKNPKNLEQIKNCLKNGADINCVENQGYYTTVSATPLMMAIDCRYDGIAEYLIKQGADVNAKNKEGETALMIAIKWGDLETAKLLINNGAKASINTKDKENNTALDIFEKSNYLRNSINFIQYGDLKNLIISNGGKRGIEIKPKIKAKAKTKQKSKSNDFERGM